MRKRINWILLLLSAVGVVCASVLTLAVTAKNSMRHAEQSVCDLTDSISKSYDYMELGEYTTVLSDLPENMRATLITEDGTVLYDSDALAAEMENHLDRPEIQDALRSGKGEDIRKSSTMHSSTYYYAVQLSDKCILRLSRPYSSIRSMVLSSIPGIAVVMVVLFGLALVLSRSLARWMMRPVEQAAYALEKAGINNEPYAELKPFFSHIREQDQQISDQKEILQQERETLGIIANNMREGLLLVSKNNTVISINPSAICMLAGRKAEPMEFIGHNYLIVNRTQQMHSCVNAALAGESKDAEFSMHGRVYHVYASPMVRLTEVQGAVVIVLDETQQRLAERSRREFSANVSHELKTPLTSISGYAEMMENGMVASMEDIRTFSGSIHKEALRLIALIEDIIRLSRIEEEPMQGDILEPVDLNDLCEAVVESLQPVAHKVKVTLQLDGSAPAIPGEDAMLSEMVYNLCENAIKYNRPGGTVWISLADMESEIRLTVKDNGIGIPEESQPRVFERFYRVDKSRSKQIGGTGLGLSIVKHVVEFHGGRVELDSNLGAGTEIRVFLPKKG
ncbi:MAG: ATP-binding protein [Eubacteriales bacterium]|nr:ATP-binding protein [Eubacteriales bacterium]